MSACSAAPAKVDAAPIIEPVTKSLNEAGVRIQNFDCPPDVDQAPGSSFRCTVTTDKGEKLPVTVTQKDDSGQLKLAWEIGPDLVVTDKLRPALSAYAQSVSSDLEVTCPKVVILPGGTGKLSCVVTDRGGQTGRLVVPLDGGAPASDQRTWSIEQT